MQKIRIIGWSLDKMLILTADGEATVSLLVPLCLREVEGMRQPRNREAAVRM